jgi:hypothetical protein
MIKPQLGLNIMLCSFFYAGASIRACRSVDRHIVAFKEDKELFLPYLHLWCILQWFLLHHKLRFSKGLKILILWSLFQPKLRRDVLVTKFDC